MAGYLGNNILPARAGELVRAAYIGRESDIAASFALATGLVERFMDLIALVVLGSLSLASTGIVSNQLEAALKAMSMIALIGVIGILIIPYIGDKLIAHMPFLPGVKPSVREKLMELANQFLRGIAALHHPLRAGIFILFTGLIWTIDGVGTIILARTLDQHLTLIQSFLLLAALGLSSAIPSTPGYVGIYQFVAVFVLKPFGISSSNALAFILVLQIMNFAIVAFWGTIAIARAPKNILTHAITQKDSGE